MDIKNLVKNADLTYNGTVERAEEGLPIGNGRMGSLLWTSPTALKMQVNRPDVLANGPSSTASFKNDRDYGYGCGYVDIDFATYGDDVFDEKTYQHLDVYNACVDINSNGIKVNCFADANSDAFAFEIEDNREVPDNIIIRIRTLRPTEVKNYDHVALSRFIKQDNSTVTLHQVFNEREFYCSSAMTVKVVGIDSKVRFNNENGGIKTVLNDRDFEDLYDSKKSLDNVNTTLVELGAEQETEMRICLPAQKGKFYLYISTSATFDKKCNVITKSLETVNNAVNTDYADLFKRHTDWWNNFWSKSYIHLWGNEKAKFIEAHYTYYLYIIASCSRGTDFAPNFGGLLFSPRGDYRHWGNMQWWNNINLTYNAILPTGHNELIMPYLNMYHNAYDSWKTAARQQWGAKGIYIGETVHELGLDVLPDDIAEELKNFLLGRGPKKFYECSEKFRKYSRLKNDMECRWNFLAGNRGSDDCDFYAFVTHLLSTTGFMAFQYYLYYTYTLDEEYLKNVAYPMIKGACEFYRTFPNTVKENDGLYHINHVSHGEGNWNGRDPLDLLTAIHGLFPLLIKIAKKLNVDTELIPVWQEFIDNVVPLPNNKDHDAPNDLTKRYCETVWVTMHLGKDTATECNRICGINPCWQLEYCTSITKRFFPKRYNIAMNTIEYMLSIAKGESDNGYSMYSWEMSHWPRTLAAMGKGNKLIDNMYEQLNCVCAPVDHILYRQNGAKAPYANRLTAREGINAISAQRLGNAAAGLQAGLLQCNGGSTELDPIIQVFPAWDSNYNAEYMLWAKGGFKVTSRFEKGEIQFVEIESTMGGICRILNPWGDKAITISNITEYDDDNSIISFDTSAGTTYIFNKI